MTDQLGLFSAGPRGALRPLARHSDPQTSRMSAREHESSGRLNAQCVAVLEAVTARGGLTSAELAHAAGLDRYMVARRLPDLRERGLVANGEARRCGVTGRAAITWAAVS